MTRPGVNRTTWKVLQVFMQDPIRHRYSSDVCKQAGLGAGSIYPTLAMLERDGWLESGIEGWRLTTAGMWRARRVLEDGTEPPSRWLRVWHWLWNPVSS